MWLFPLMVWLVGSFFLRGDLGKWLDDYAAHVRNPVTGGFAWGDLLRYPWWFFWRPVHVQLVFALQTLLWNHDWANHLFSALMHLLACVSAWSFVKDVGVRGWIAAATLVFLLCMPQGFEAIFWPATVSTSIGTAGLFLAAKIVFRFSQGRHRGSGRWVLVALGVLVPCCYEQPAAAMAMLPIVYLAGVCDRDRLDVTVRGLGLLRHGVRMVGLLAPVALGILAYMAAYALTVRLDAFARESQLASADGFWSRVRFLLTWFFMLLEPTSGFHAAWKAGLARLASVSVVEAVVLVIAVLSAVAWVVWVGRAGQRADLSAERRPAKGWVEWCGWGSIAMIALFLTCGMLIGLLPVMAIQAAGLSSRLMYMPSMCATLCAAALLEVLARTLAGRGWRAIGVLRRLVLWATPIAAAWSCVVLVGIQTMYQHRHAADMASLRELVERLPEPLPGTIFVPIRMKVDPAAPTSDRLRQSFQSIWQSPWAINTMIKHVYRRRDVHATTIYANNQSSALVRLGPKTLMTWSHFMWKLPTPRMVDEFPEFDAERVVPLVLNCRMRVESVDTILAMTPGGDPIEFPVKQRLAQRDNDTEPAAVRMSVPIDDGGEWLRHWTWASGARAGTPVKFARLASHGAAELAIRMHPPTPGVTIADGDTDAMITALPANQRAQTIVFWATFDETTIDLSVLGDGVELVWSIDGVGEIARSRVDPRVVAENHRWVHMAVNVPPSEAKRVLRLSVGPGTSGNNSYDRVIVSCGSVMPIR